MTVLVFLELLAGSVWVGGLVGVAVAARSARAELGPRTQILFFRSLGRSYLPVGGGALLVALGCGAALLARSAWNAEKTCTVAIGACLITVTALGVLQARALSRLRSLEAGRGAEGGGLLRRRARRALLLRAAIGILTLVEVVLAARLAR